MIELDTLAVFLEIAEGNSISGAARHLNISAMAASRKLATLEASLSVRLVHRSTRSISLTPEGERFVPFALRLRDAHESAQSVFNPREQRVDGVLKITSTIAFGRSVVMPLLAEMVEQHPDLSAELTFNDEIVNIAAQGIDLALRIANLSDSALVARRLADNPRILIASPKYLAGRGIPESIDDLALHSCIGLHNVPRWRFSCAGETITFKPVGKFSANNVETVLDACLRGLGIGLLSYWDVRHELDRGELVELRIPGVETELLAIWAVFPSRECVPTRVRAFLELLEPTLRRGARAPADRS